MFLEIYISYILIYVNLQISRMKAWAVPMQIWGGCKGRRERGGYQFHHALKWYEWRQSGLGDISQTKDFCKNMLDGLVAKGGTNFTMLWSEMRSIGTGGYFSDHIVTQRIYAQLLQQRNQNILFGSKYLKSYRITLGTKKFKWNRRICQWLSVK